MMKRLLNRLQWWLGIGRLVLMIGAILTVSFVGAMSIDVISVNQRYPWSGLVDIVYRVNYVSGEVVPNVLEGRLEAVAQVGDKSYPVRVVDTLPLSLESGEHSLIWNAIKDGCTVESSDFKVSFRYVAYEKPRWLVVDLSAGMSAKNWPVKYLDAEPEGGFNTPEYKTSKLVLRKIPAGGFIMGSPISEYGRMGDRETQHPVYITHPFYIGLFPITREQYQYISGAVPPSNNCTGFYRPLTRMSYLAFYGLTGKEQITVPVIPLLQQKTGLAFNVPTEAQWEYACRSGTTTPFNNGVECNSDVTYDEQLAKIALTISSGYSPTWGIGPVGTKLPNAWGLYDMHGNVWEFVRDVFTQRPEWEVLDPCLTGTSIMQSTRGGCYSSNEKYCRCAMRTWENNNSTYDSVGFRVIVEVTE